MKTNIHDEHVHTSRTSIAYFPTTKGRAQTTIQLCTSRDRTFDSADLRFGKPHSGEQRYLNSLVQSFLVSGQF